MNLEDTLSPAVLTLFRSAGWYPGREVPLAAPLHHPASSILSAFSGLHVGQVGDGDTCAASDIDFQPLDLDEATILEWSRLLATHLVGVGLVHNGHGELWVASDGRCFGRSLIHEAFWLDGEIFSQAMEGLLRGLRARPLIHPKQTSVMLYGDVFTRDHPDVYDFTKHAG
jgi:hypothetical protein